MSAVSERVVQRPGRRRRYLAAAGALVPIAVVGALVAVSVGRADEPRGAAGDRDAPYLNPRLPVEQRVDDLLARMTLEEKAGQMTQAERAQVAADPTLITSLQLGSILSGGGSGPDGGTPAAWADMVDAFQRQALRTRLRIPLLYGADAVHGHNNVLGATVFPHNIGMGATRDPALVERVQHVAATETRATGVPWTLSPCVCVTRDARWGRSYESFGEDPELVAEMTRAVSGLQGRQIEQLDDPDRVLATVKHFAGDGDTRFGSSTTGKYTIDQGVTVSSRARFQEVDLAPYVSAVRRRAGSVMPSFSSVDWTEDGVGNPMKVHAHEELITRVLKGRLGFDGFVISDWEGIHQLPGDWPAQVRAGVNAGIDMFMEPEEFAAFRTTLIEEVRAGRVPQSRVDDAVRRILTKKFQLGLFERPFADRRALASIGSAQHRALAREAVAKSQVLLKNSGGVLPLAPDADVYVAGRSADDVGNQSGGWTVTWQGFSGNAGHQPGTSILAGIREVAPDARVRFSADGSAPAGGSDVAVVVVGETPYAEGFGDVGGPDWSRDPADAGVEREPRSMDLQPEDRRTVDRVCAEVRKCVVLVVSGRPQVVGDRLAAIDGLVASWLPGTEGAGVADVLFGRQPFTGRLPVTWPASAGQEPINVGDATYQPAFPYGWGLSTEGAPVTRTDVLRDRAQAAIATAAQGVPRGAAALIASADQHVLAGRSARAEQLLQEAAGSS